MRKILESFIVAFLLTSLSYLVAELLGWGDSLDWLEISCVFTSFSCTYLCVMGSRWNFPIGILSVSLVGYLFFSIGLYASMLLSLYLIPVLVIGWFKWGSGAATLPVSRIASKLEWRLYAYASLLTLLVMTWVTNWMGAKLAGFDSLIFVGSIWAQYLLTNRKIETWGVWAVVNIVAIYTYINSGAYLVGLQYVFFLINTTFGYVMWRKELKAQEVSK